MTNKPMLSVERELIELAVKAIEKHHSSVSWSIATELRALLDKTVCHNCAGIERNIPCPECKPATQHQPAPVAFVIDIESAAKKLAQCMDYPWEYMPEQGRQSMREHAKAVVEASRLNGVKS